MHRRRWLILSIALPLAVISVMAGLALLREPSAQAPVELTPQEARLIRLKHSVADNPTDFDSRLRLGWTYHQLGRYPEALEQYQLILNRRPRSVATLYYRGLIYRDTGADLQAQESFLAVLAIKKDHLLASIALGEYYLDRAEYTNLLEAIEPAAKEHPKVGKLHYLMGRGLEGTGDVSEARKHYRDALKYAPDMAKARVRLQALDRVPE